MVTVRTRYSRYLLLIGVWVLHLAQSFSYSLTGAPMEQDNTIILTSTLMPSAIILAFAIVLTIWFHRTIDELPAPSALTIIINQNINPNGILLQQQPPIVAPIP